MFGTYIGRAALAALAIAAAPFAAGAQTITNGNFEGFGGCGTNGFHAGCNNGSGTSSAFDSQTQQLNGTLYSGATGGTYTNWTTTSGYAFILTPSQATGGFTGPAGSLKLWDTTNGGAGPTAITSSPAGGNFLAIDPSYPRTGDYVQTSVTGLVTGQTYTISYYTAAAQQSGFDLLAGQTQIDNWTVKVLDGGTSALKATVTQGNFSAVNHGFSGWIQQSFTMTATATSMLLQFIANSNISSSQPPFVLLDGVTATVNTPEPSAMALLATGVIGLVGIGRRRRRA